MPRGYVDVEAIANAVLQRTGSPRVANLPAIDIESILRDYYHFDVAHVPKLEIGGRRLLACFAPNQQLVLVDAYSYDPRKRFSLAHELGHAEIDFADRSTTHMFDTPDDSVTLMFRCSSDDVRENSDKGNDRSEVLANKFASYLLMPGGLVREVWKEFQDTAECADALGVSKQAIAYRLSNLGLV